MSLIVALVLASVILMYWRQFLFLIAWAFLALVLLGIISILHFTDQQAPAASVGVSQGCTRLTGPVP
ncbi:hypothetical protein [Intrasporangium sp.]|jgi:hypothetical protein|uniref:hypothetical protein n=1 Tax=Intrasporangium sp. TaxID=1925024 RepID=UPI0033657920